MSPLMTYAPSAQALRATEKPWRFAYAAAALPVAFALSGWVHLPDGMAAQSVAWTAGHFVGALCAAFLVGALVRGVLLRTVAGALAFLGVAVGGLLWPWRGLAWLTASPWVGCVLVVAGLILGILPAMVLRSSRAGALLLSFLALLVAVGLADLQVHQSAEGTARRFARAVSREDWPRAERLVTPRLRGYLNEHGRRLSDAFRSVIITPSTLVLDEVRACNSDEVLVVLFQPRRPGHSPAGSQIYSSPNNLMARGWSRGQRTNVGQNTCNRPSNANYAREGRHREFSAFSSSSRGVEPDLRARSGPGIDVL